MFNLSKLHFKYADNINQDIISARAAIEDCYKMYLTEDSKYKEFVFLVQSKQKNCKEFLDKYKHLLKLVKGSSNFLIFEQLNDMLKYLFDMKKDVREDIDDVFKIHRESDRNAREHLKSKFEMIRDRVFSILKKQAKVYEKHIAGDEPEVDSKSKLTFEEVERQRKVLNKDKLFKFRFYPFSKTYGLDSEEVMERILFYPELRSKVESIINAVDRGHLPKAGPEIKAETAAVAEFLKLKQTNESLLEQNVLPNRQFEIALQKRKEMEKRKREKALENDPVFINNNLRKEKEDQAYRDNFQKELKEEMEESKKEQDVIENKLINKYNNLSLLDFLKN